MAFLLIILSVACVVSAQTCVFNNGTNTFDFTSLTGSSFSVGDAPYSYTFTPCANACVGPSQIKASVCQSNGGDPVAPVSIFDASMIWSSISNGVQFTTQNGGPPNCHPSGQPRFATIQFICDNVNPPQFSITNEPGLQGCAVSPGYVLQLNTPLACPGTPPPTSCPYTQTLPCVIETYDSYLFSDGETIIFNQNRGVPCGTIVFSNYRTNPPPDTCSTFNGGSVYAMVSHMDLIMVPRVKKLLKGATVRYPAIFFWDTTTNRAVIGPEPEITPI